jgi:hypothetical protein
MSLSVELEARYHIDFEWYQENSRSFAALAESRLCPECQSKPKKKATKSDQGLLKVIGQCCAQKPDFTTPSMPILESVFRLFLANGNEPLSVIDISQQMRQARAESFVPGPEVLGRILRDESFYGLRCLDEPQVEEEEEEPLVAEASEVDTSEVSGEENDMSEPEADVEAPTDTPEEADQEEA